MWLTTATGLAFHRARRQPLDHPRWMNMYNATTGTVVMTEAAMSWPQWKTSP